MRNRLVCISDDEDGVSRDENLKTSKMLVIDDGDDSELEEGELREYDDQIMEERDCEMGNESKNKDDDDDDDDDNGDGGDDDDEEEEEDESEDEDPEELMAHPIGDVVRVSGKGEWTRNHYETFEYDGILYNLEDTVMFVPQQKHLKPRVAILKDITQTVDGSLMVTGQWFYRSEDAKKEGGGNWQTRMTRELFYSFFLEEEQAECVLHKCVVHFIPLNKQIPNRKQHSGFVVQHVYDPEQKTLLKLRDKTYDVSKQHEIDLLVQKTISRLGDLPELEPGDKTADQEDQSMNKLLLRRDPSSLDISVELEKICRSHQSANQETTGRSDANPDKYYAILLQYKVLKGDPKRDKWLARLLKAIEFMCTSMDSKSVGKEKSGSNYVNGSHNGTPNSDMSFAWPDAAVIAIAALEKAAHNELSSDYRKYNQKLRHLKYYLENNAVLAQRLLSGELEPSHMLNMSANELKEGLTGEEIANLRSRGTCRSSSVHPCNYIQIG